MCSFSRSFVTALAILTAMLLAGTVSAQNTNYDQRTYYADAYSEVQADYPYNATVYQSDGNQIGQDFSKIYSSTTNFGTDTAPGVQLAYSYARSGSLGFFIHGQTAPLPAVHDPIRLEEFDTTSMYAIAYTNDVLQIPENASGPVDIQFNLKIDGTARYSYNPLASNFGYLPGNFGFHGGYGGELVVKDIETGQTWKTDLDVIESGDGFQTLSSPQPFTVEANPGDLLSVFTQGSAAASAAIRDNYFESDFSHTAHTYADVLTPGVTLTSLSGHDYSSPAPVPEASSMISLGVLLSLGLGGLIISVRRRKASAP